jgi:hypothetical protein
LLDDFSIHLHWPRNVARINFFLRGPWTVCFAVGFEQAAKQKRWLKAPPLGDLVLKYQTR